MNGRYRDVGRVELFVVALGLIWILFGTVVGQTPHAPSTSSPQETESELGELRSKIADIKHQIDTTAKARGDQDRALREVEQQIGDLARRLRVLTGRLRRQTERLERLKDREADRLSELDRQRAALARQVRQAYVVGRQERLKLLLNQEEPDKIARVLAYYDYLNRARAERLASIRYTLRLLTSTRIQIQRETDKLARLKARQEIDRDNLEQVRLARRAIVANLTKNLTNQGAELERLQQDEKDLTDLLEGLRHALSDIPPPQPGQQGFERSKGKLPWPTEGRLTRRFGGRKIGALRWEGVIIQAEEGQEILAVHDGRVAYADWLRGYGLLMILDHGEGYMTLYGHNQSLLKEAGDWVSGGEPIASVGASGGQSAPGIYFEVRYRQRPMNPARWCRKLKGRNTRT